MLDEDLIAAFWDEFPCGDSQVGGLERFAADHQAFFDEYDAFRYTKEAHILECLDGLEVAGKRVLEIGLGEGADSEQLIRRGATWSGLDLTPESVRRVETRLALRGLPYEKVVQGSATANPYPPESFDLVFSHGVLHHIPDIVAAQREIHRVLVPDGELVVMVYAKWSLNYLVAIGLVRRAGLLGLRLLRRDPGGISGQHLENMRRIGTFRYLRMSEFIHHNTDGPLNPYAKVYDRRRLREDFPDFELVRTYRRFMHAPPLPVSKLPFGRIVGWHLWAHLRPRQA